MFSYLFVSYVEMLARIARKITSYLLRIKFDRCRSANSPPSTFISQKKNKIYYHIVDHNFICSDVSTRFYIIFHDEPNETKKKSIWNNIHFIFYLLKSILRGDRIEDIVCENSRLKIQHLYFLSFGELLYFMDSIWLGINMS